MIRLKLPLLLILSTLTLNIATAKYFTFQHFDVSGELPSSQVYQIIQDKNNYIWFATDRGVARYDGISFKTYTRKDGLTDEVVFGFYPENNGKVWFYTYQGGLCYFYQDQIIEPEFNPALKKYLDSIGNPVIISLLKDAGNIWVGTNSKHIIKITPEGKISFLASHDVTQPALRVLKTATPTRKVVFNSSQVQPPLDQISFTSLPDFKVQVIELNSTGSQKRCSRVQVLWLNDHTYIYAYSSNLYKIANGQVVQHTELGPERCILHALHRDDSGKLWVGTTRGALAYPNANLNIPPKVFLKSQPISSIWQDHQGGCWFSSLNEGVFYIPNFHVRSISNDQLANNKATQLVANSYGVYAATTSEDLMIIPNGEPHGLKIIQEGCHYRARPSLTLWDDHVLAREGSPGRTYYKDTVKLQTPHSGLLSRSYRNDDRSTILWRTIDGELQLISGTGDSIISSLRIGRHSIRCVATTENRSKIWVGGSKLYRYTEQGLISMGKKYPKLNVRISDLDLIEDQYLLITTRGQGLLRYNHQNQTLRKLEGVPNEYCNQSYIDEHGVVWVASLAGVTRIESITSAEPDYYHYSSSHGLISNESHSIVTYKDQIWVATGMGISWWHRSWLPPEESAPVYLKQISVNGNSENIRDGQVLQNDENNLHFSFGAVNFRSPMKYQYRLLGAHDDWKLNAKPEALYTALEPGEYTFQVKPKQAGEVHSSITFFISPPFWKKYWFIAGVSILVVGVLALILYLKNRVKRKENKLYSLFLHSEGKALRAQVNPHFLFNAFDSLREMLGRKEYIPAQFYMKRLSYLMRMILQHSRRNETLLRDEVKLLHHYLRMEKLRFGKLLNYQIEISPEINKDITVLPSMLLQPYVENAVKHGVRSRSKGNGTVIITFEAAGDSLLVKIKDDGKGYKSDQSHPVSKKSFGMKISRDRIHIIANSKRDVYISPLNPEDHEYPGTVVELYLPLKTISNYEPSPS